MQPDWEAECARLQGIIAAALAARAEGRMGDAWRILQTGSDKPLLPRSGVLEGGG